MSLNAASAAIGLPTELMTAKKMIIAAPIIAVLVIVRADKKLEYFMNRLFTEHDCCRWQTSIGKCTMSKVKLQKIRPRKKATYQYILTAIVQVIPILNIS